MKRWIQLSVDVEDGEAVLLVAILSPEQTLSIARKADKAEFGSLYAQLGPNDRQVTVVYGEPRKA